MSLFFVTLTPPLHEPTPINISKTITINNQEKSKDKLTFGDLKVYIWDIIGDNSKDYFKVKLWKVDLEEGKEKWKELETLARSYTEAEIENFGGEKLLSTSKVVDVFEDVSDNRVHILVQLPSPPATTAETLASLLNSSKLQPPAIPILSHKFYDRDQALNSMLEIARFNYCSRKSSDHKDHRFVLIPGGIGIGKTRMSRESRNLLDNLTRRNDDTDEFVEALKNPYYFSIDLNNGCKYIPGFDDKVSASVRIGSRVAVASGLVSEKLSDLSKNSSTFLM